MSRLIGLYPQPWRARYEDELRDALSLRPLTFRDRVDLVRGALDARLHPELAPSGLGAPVPVGPDTGSRLPRTRTGFPTTMFLAIAAASAFFLAAVLLPIQERFIGARFQEVLLIAASVALGAVLWRTRAGLTGRASGLVARLGAVVIMSTVLVVAGLAWPSATMTAIVVLAAGSLIVGVSGLIELIRRRGHVPWVALVYLALVVALGVCFEWAVTKGVSVVLGGYAVVSLRLGATDRLTLRRTVVGVGSGVLLVALVAFATAATSPWASHDGYSLACGGVERVACTEQADRVATAVRAQDPTAIITHMEVAADRSADVCWRGATVMSAGCWFMDP